MTADLSRFAVGGATRPDSFSGFQPQFASSLAAMFAAAPPEIQGSLRISSGYRSPEVQARLYREAVAKYGSPEAARKWVAPPGNSQHNHGHAADLKFLAPAALKWAHENAAKFGLSFPMKHENWHVELASARGQQPTTMAAAVPPQNPSAPTTATAPMMNRAPSVLGAESLPGSGGTLADMFAPGLAQIGQAFTPPQNQDADRQRRLQALFGAGGVADVYG